MGLRTLVEFRDDLDRILGYRGHAPARLDSWINDGIQDLGGSIDFETLNRTSRATILATKNSVTLPSDLNWLRGPVRSITDDVTLIFEDGTQFVTRDEDTDGPPTFWTRIGDTLRVWTTPEVATVVQLLYNKFPTYLVADADVSMFTPTWDRVIEMKAIAHALLDLGENANAQDWFGHASAQIRSRLMSDEFETEGASAGVRVITTQAQLGETRT